jgi:hypothetical protein
MCSGYRAGLADGRTQTKFACWEALSVLLRSCLCRPNILSKSPPPSPLSLYLLNPPDLAGPRASMPSKVLQPVLPQSLLDELNGNSSALLRQCSEIISSLCQTTGINGKRGDKSSFLARKRVSMSENSAKHAMRSITYRAHPFDAIREARSGVRRKSPSIHHGGRNPRRHMFLHPQLAL